MINDQTRNPQLSLEFGMISISIECDVKLRAKIYSECSIYSILHPSPYLECDLIQLSKIFLE